MSVLAIVVASVVSSQGGNWGLHGTGFRARFIKGQPKEFRSEA